MNNAIHVTDNVRSQTFISRKVFNPVIPQVKAVKQLVGNANVKEMQGGKSNTGSLEIHASAYIHLTAVSG